MSWRTPVEREVKKRLRVAVALFVLATLAAAALLSVFYPSRYVPLQWAPGQKGFVALCYEGVARQGTGSVVTPARLREQLGALRDEGYVALGSAEIAAYRESGTPLPQKSVYLAFADGRAETILLADRVLRELDFRGALPESEAVSPWDTVYLPVKQREAYLKTGFWEELVPGFTKGVGLNLRDSELTWIFPQEDWSANKLLTWMAVLRDEPFPAESVRGWDSLAGCLSSDGKNIILTSPPGQPAIVRLQTEGKYEDWHVRVNFPDSEGIRSVYLRADAQLEHFVRVRLENGILTGTQRMNGVDEPLFRTNVEDGPIEIDLNGGELLVKLGGETAAWTRTAVRQGGYLCLEAIPDAKDAIGDGVFQISVSRPQGREVRKVYDSFQPVRWVGLESVRLWNSLWEWLRVSL